MKRITALLSLMLVGALPPLTAYAEPVPYPVEIPDPTGSIFSSDAMTIQPGDLDGDAAVSVSDLVSMQRYLLGKKELDSKAFLAADHNHDGETDIFDLALCKAAVLNGTSTSPWSICTDILDVRWTNLHTDDDITDSLFVVKTFDDAETFSAWLNSQTDLSPETKDTYLERYPASFFTSQTLTIFTLPATAFKPWYQIRGIRKNGDTLAILVGETGAGFDPYEVPTVQSFAVALPRSMTEGKTVRVLPCGEMPYLSDLMSLYGEGKYQYTGCTYTSPDGSYTLQVKHTANRWNKEDNQLDFAWKEECETLQLDSYPTTLSDPELLSPEWGKTGVILHFPDKTGTEQAVTFPYPDRTVKRQSAVFRIKDTTAPEMDSVTVHADCWGTLSKKCEIRSAMGNVLSRGVVGRVGVPIEFSTSGTVTNPEITVHYDATELRGIPETNLIILREGETYTAVSSTLDTEADTLTFTPPSEGTYIVVDAYTWYARWGGDVSKYAYTVNRADYPSNWEREGNTGCIMELADKDWAMRNSPDFRVSTAQELASAVWYVNAMADNRKCSILLEDDIDLKGLDWAPLGWQWAEFGSTYTSTCFVGTIDGQGHTIRNLRVRDGFVQRSQNLTVKNITFENAAIEGGLCAGIVCGEALGTTELTGVHVSGTIQIPTVSSNRKYGALIGSGTAFVSECTADVTVNGKPCPYLTSQERDAAETVVEHPVTLTLNSDLSVTREKTDYQNISWVILQDGKQVLDRNAENEMTLDISKIVKLGGVPFAVHGSEYQIYLKALVNGKYVPISNTVTFLYE